jgi:hypothetical protein
MNKINQAADITTAIERSKVNLSGSKTRDEWILKNNGVTIMAASQPTSISPSHQREILDSILFPSSLSKAYFKNLTALK